MGLRNINIRRERITLPDGQAFEVRGISVFDIMPVLNEYGPRMALVFGRVMQQRAEGVQFTSSSIKSTIREVAGEFPDVMAALMALAADDYSPETMLIAKQLPINAQLETIEAIFSLTFQGEGDVKKLLESLTTMIAATTGTLTQTMEMASLDGIGGSVAK